MSVNGFFHKDIRRQENVSLRQTSVQQRTSRQVGPDSSDKQLELASQVEKESKEENKEAINNVEADITSKGVIG